MADSMAAAHAAGRPSPCSTFLLRAEAWMPCSMKVTEERLLNKKKKLKNLLTSGPQELLSVLICVFKGGVHTAACDTARVDKCHCEILKHF